MVHNNIGHWEIDGPLVFQDNTAFSTNASSVVEFDSGTYIDINPTSALSAPLKRIARQPRGYVHRRMPRRYI